MDDHVSVIVPHYDDLDRLDLCLASLGRQTFPSDRFEIVVADNDSPCGPDAVRDRIAGRARLTICREPGAGPARNAGVAEARHDVLAFIDSDCVADAGWLAAGVSALARADLIGGQVRVSVREPGRRSGAEAFEQVFAFDNRRYVERDRFTVTANLFTRKRVFAAIGGFRTRVSEDIEWCWRAVGLGFTIAYEPGAGITHPARTDWPQLWRKTARLDGERFALACESAGGRRRWFLRSLALPATIVADGVRMIRSPALDTSGERARGLATLARVRIGRFLNLPRLMMGKG